MKRTPLLRNDQVTLYQVPRRLPSELSGEILFADPLRLYSGDFLRYNPSVLVTKHSMRIFDKMRRDDQIKAALTFKKNAVLSSGWEVVSPQDQDEDWEVSELVRENFRELTPDDRSLEDVLMEVMTALDYGFSVSEKLFEPWESRLWLKDIKTRAPHDIEFRQNEFGDILGIEQQGSTGRKIVIPEEKVVLYVHGREFSNPYGTSDLEAAYRAWVLKDNSYKWLAMYLEKLGIPPIFLLYNPNSYQGAPLTQLQNVLQNMAAATAGLIPRRNKEDIEPWTPELGSQTQSVFIPALNMFNQDIARAILIPNLLGYTAEGQAGSYARAVKQFDAFIMTVLQLRRTLASTMNAQVVRQLVQLNFGEQEAYPEFRFLPLQDEDRLQLFQTWISLTASGTVTKQKSDEVHLRKSMGMPERQEGDEMPTAPKPTLPGDPNAATDEEKDDDAEEDTHGTAEDDDEEDDEEVEEEDDKEQEKKNALDVSRRVDFKRIAADLDAQEARALTNIREALIEVRTALRKQVEKGFDGELKFLKKFKMKGFIPVRQAVGGFLRDVFEAGRRDLGHEIYTYTKKYASPLYTPKEALRWLSEKEFWITGVMEDKMLNDARGVLLNAVKTGEPLGDTIQKLDAMFEPYVGDPDVLRDGEALSPHRLETIVRTNATDAYNEGRVIAARDPDIKEFIQGMQYSAILDNRTTEICASLDNRIIPMDDPALDKLIPPNHFNCRSVLVPVPVGVQVSEDDFITQEEIGRALDLMDSGFGGSA